jgi:hypothetical protein
MTEPVSGFDALAYKRDIAPNFIVIYAGEKVGKSTVLVSTINETIEGGEILEKDSHLHITDVDHGLEPFINRWIEKGKPYRMETDPDGKQRIIIPNVTVDTVSSRKEFHDAVWTFPDGYQFYAIDTMTRAGKHFIKSVQPKQIPGERARNANMDIAALFEDYIDRLEELAWDLNKQGAWLIVLCHQKPAVYEKNELVAPTQPLLYGSAGAKLNRVATGIWRLQLQEIQTPNGWVTGRQFRTAQTEAIVAGDRTGALNEIEPANIAKCIKKIREHRASGIKEVATI